MATEPEKRYTVFLCPICGEERPGPGEGEVDLTRTDDERDVDGYLICDGSEDHEPVRFAPVEVVPASTVEVVPAAEVGVTNSVPVVTEADSSPAASGAHLSTQEAFADCLRVATTKEQEIAALRLADAHRTNHLTAMEEIRGELKEARQSLISTSEQNADLLDALQELQEGLQREIETLDDLVRMYVASPGGDETAEALAQASDRLLALLPHSPDGREEGSSGG